MPKKKKTKTKINFVQEIEYGKASSLANGNRSGPGAVITLRRDNHVVKGAELHAKRFPSIEVRARSYRAANALVTPDRPVLVEGGRADEGGLVHALVDVDVVHRAVGRDFAAFLGPMGWVIRAIALDDIVLYEGARGPAVNGEVAVSIGSPRARVGN